MRCVARPFSKRLLSLLSLLSVAGCSSVLFSGLNVISPRSDLAESRGIVFDPVHQLQLDVYRPLKASAAPVVVFFYGGSWEWGRRQDYRWLGEALARQGFVVVVPDYRKYPQVKLDGFMSDAAAATAWARQHAASYGGDSKQLFVMGHSAGAHLAIMLASDGQWLAMQGMRPADLAGAIGMAGPYNFLPLQSDALRGMFGSTAEQQARSQPINFVDGDEPSMLLLHGDADKTVWSTNSSSMAAAVTANGGHAQLILYPGISHAGILLSLSPTFIGKSSAMADSVAFIRQRVAELTLSTR